MTYQQLDQYLGVKQERPALEPNTRIRRYGPVIAVLLHDHKILTYYQSGEVELNSCGYRTVTTKRRMNQYLDGYYVTQQNFKWLVQNTYTSRVFQDRMVIRSLE